MIRECKRFYSDPGSPIRQLYAPKVNSDGSIDLVEAGIENTDDYIQSFESCTDMNLLIAEIKAGDLSRLQARPGSYGDFTKLPKTYAEALQLQIDSNRLFESLPVDVKQKFDFDANKFFAAAGTEEWYKNIEDVLPDEVKSVIFPQPVVDVKDGVSGES